MGGYQGKHSKVVTQIGSFAFSINKFLEIQSSFHSWHREGDTLTNRDFPYKC